MRYQPWLLIIYSHTPHRTPSDGTYDAILCVCLSVCVHTCACVCMYACVCRFVCLQIRLRFLIVITYFFDAEHLLLEPDQQILCQLGLDMESMLILNGDKHDFTTA